MRFRLLGKSGLRVSELCLGTMTFGEDWGWGSSQEESKKIFEKFVEAGGNFFDTANGYTNGTSERMLGDFIRAERERYVVATKYSFSTQKGDPNASGNHRKNIVQALDASLKRMHLEYIDLYWLHAWDELTPIDEVMRALDDMVRAGKILYLGCSDVPAWWLSKANTLAELRGWTQFVALQVEYSLLERTPERELLGAADHFGMTVTPWSPLASGFLTGKYSREKLSEEYRLSKANFLDIDERAWSVVDTVQRIAKKRKCSAAQIALAWACQGGKMIPILGARTLQQLEDNLGVLKLELSEDEKRELDMVSAVKLGFPLEFLHRPAVHEFLHGGTFGKILK